MSGGLYKYPCRNRWTANCPNWVMVSGGVCADCVAAGRDASEEQNPLEAYQASRLPMDVCVPTVQDGTVTWLVMEVVMRGSGPQEWGLKMKDGRGQSQQQPGQQQPHQQPQQPPQHMSMVTTTSATPGAVVATAGVHQAYARSNF